MTVASTSRDRLLAELGVLLVVVCWAANFVVVKAAIGDLPSLVFTGLRYLLASLSLLLLLRWQAGSIRLPARELLISLGLGALGFGVYQVLWVSGLESITAGESALLVATSPIVVALVATALGVEALTPLKVVGIALSFVGTVLVIGAGTGLTLGASLVGDALTLGGTAAYATYTVLTAKAMRTIPPIPLTAWAVVGSTIVLVPLMLWQAATTPGWGLDLGGVLAIAYSGILAAGLANVLISHGVRLVGPTRVTVLQYGVPPLAVVFGAVALAEPILAGHVLGGLVIVLGVIVMRAGEPRGATPGSVARAARNAPDAPDATPADPGTSATA